MMKYARLTLMFVVLIALVCVGRLAAHTPNFTPLGAAAMFAGAYFTRRWVAVLAPLAAMLISDCFVGFYTPGVMVAVYASVLAPVLIGAWVRTRGPLALAGGAVASSVVFYVLTNFAVWYCGSWYGGGVRGLLACYAAAVPFLRLMLAGDLTWTFVLFGGWRLVTAVRGHPAPRPTITATA